jgi:hypothetical protein
MTAADHYSAFMQLIFNAANDDYDSMIQVVAGDPNLDVVGSADVFYIGYRNNTIYFQNEFIDSPPSTGATALFEFKRLIDIYHPQYVVGFVEPGRPFFSDASTMQIVYHGADIKEAEWW